jgi:hypothetical protein
MSEKSPIRRAYEAKLAAEEEKLADRLQIQADPLIPRNTAFLLNPAHIITEKDPYTYRELDKPPQWPLLNPIEIATDDTFDAVDNHNAKRSHVTCTLAGADQALKEMYAPALKEALETELTGLVGVLKDDVNRQIWGHGNPLQAHANYAMQNDPNSFSGVHPVGLGQPNDQEVTMSNFNSQTVYMTDSQVKRARKGTMKVKEALGILTETMLPVIKLVKGNIIQFADGNGNEYEIVRIKGDDMLLRRVKSNRAGPAGEVFEDTYSSYVQAIRDGRAHVMTEDE